MHHVIRAMLLPIALFACGSPGPARSPSPKDSTAGTRGPKTATHVPVAEASGPPVAPECRITATETQGCGKSEVEALVAPVRPRIESCRHGSGGKLRVRVHESGGKLAFDAQAGSSLDPADKQCVLEALSTLNDTTSTNLSFGPSVPPTGFTSLLTIEW